MERWNVLFTVIVVVRFSFAGAFYPYQSGSTTFTKKCSKRNAPCNIAHKYIHHTGEETELPVGKPICTCQGGNKCPENGNDPNRTLNLVIGAHNGMVQVMQLRFCEAVISDKVCQQNQIAGIMKGGRRSLAHELAASYCRCPDTELLHLQYTDSKIHYKLDFYVCSMPTCETTTMEGRRCMQQIRLPLSQPVVRLTRRLCICPRGDCGYPRSAGLQHDNFDYCLPD